MFNVCNKNNNCSKYLSLINSSSKYYDENVLIDYYNSNQWLGGGQRENL